MSWLMRLHLTHLVSDRDVMADEVTITHLGSDRDVMSDEVTMNSLEV